MRKRRGTEPHELGLAPQRGDPAAPGRVTFRTGRLEPRLVLAIGAFTIWSAVLLNPSGSIVWLSALYAAAIGAWCRISPARHQAMLLGRAALLLMGALVLQVTPDAGGPDGPFFIWPAMVIAVYSLLLSGRWVTALWVLTAMEFIAAHALAHAVASWPLALSQAGMLAFFAFAAEEYGRSVRELDQKSELSRRDPNSRLYNEAGFFAHGGQLFEECRSRKRPFSMILLNSADLREVANLAGKKATNQLFAQLVRRLEAATPSGGLTARTDAVEFALALPGVAAVRAAQLLYSQLGQPPKVEVALKGNKLTVILDSVIAEATMDVSSLEDMYDRMRVQLLQRSGEAPSMPAEPHSTLKGMLESDSVIPRDARPTMPMSYADSVPPRPPAPAPRAGRKPGNQV